MQLGPLDLDCTQMPKPCMHAMHGRVLPGAPRLNVPDVAVASRL